MRSKKKFTVAILALALVAVAAVTSVIAVLAATQTTVSNTFTITYTAVKQVNASVYAGWNQGTLNASSANTTYTQIGGADVTFSPRAETIAEITKDAGNAEINLGSDITKFAVFKFGFTNRSEVADNAMTVTLTSASATSIAGINNTNAYYVISSDENNLDSSITVTTNDGAIVTTGYTALTSASNVTVNVPANTGVNTNKNVRYIYILIFVDDIEQNVSASNVSIAWDLTSPDNPTT